MEQQPTTPKGLPRYFMGIGMCLIILPVIFMGITKLMYDDVRAEFGDHNRQMLRVIFDSLIIIGLTFITLTRSKVETEATRNARLTGIVGGFMAGIVMALLTPLFALAGFGSTDNMNTTQLVIWMLIMSLVFRFSAKKKTVEKQ